MAAVIVNESKWRSDKSLGFVYVPFDWRVPDSAASIYTFIHIYLCVESANKDEFFNIAIEIMNRCLRRLFAAWCKSANNGGQLIAGARIYSTRHPLGTANRPLQLSELLTQYLRLENIEIVETISKRSERSRSILTFLTSDTGGRGSCL